MKSWNAFRVGRCRWFFGKASGSCRTFPSTRTLHLEALEQRALLAVNPFPVPLDPTGPLGSLTFGGSRNDRFDVPGETDSFTVSLNSGQTLTAILSPEDPSIEGRVELLNPDSVSLRVATAGASGQNVALQAVSIATDGVYRIDVTSQTGSGDYKIDLLLNAVAEDEELHGISNDTIAAAQSLEASSISLQDDADRLAVLGVSEGGDDLFAFNLVADQLTSLALTSLDGGDLGLELLGSSEAVLARGVEGANSVDEHVADFMAPSAGTYYARVTGQLGQSYCLVVTRDATFDLRFDSALPQTSP